MKEEIIHIVCCTDGGYIMPTGVMLRSLCSNNSNTPIHVHAIVDKSVMEEQKQQLVSVVNSHDKVSFYDAEKLNCSFPKIGVTNLHVTAASYYRLFLTQLLPDDVEKVLYLDGDIIVRGSISELWNLDISKVALAAVKDMDEKMNLQRVDYPTEYGYFNAGVLLVNLLYWRQHRMQDAFTSFINCQAEKIVYHDQDVLNYTLYDTKRWMPMKYNAQNGFFFKKKYQLFDSNGYESELQAVLDNPVIVHYTLGKPWLRFTSNPYRKDFWNYIKQTPWSSYKAVVKRKKGETVIDLLKNIVKVWLKYQ